MPIQVNTFYLQYILTYLFLVESAPKFTSALITSCFVDPSAWSSSSSPPPPSYKLDITDRQADALDAIVK